ncbi:hypothetical protein J3R30DRAFT_1034598 [Lentinula aciculospora]|uniref:Phosphotransferase n=1 Tax=Lentinula aciculospora TaxID=153920 RepID=A0A9W9DIF5_9AGAR|nr:hypothetical protein J3R30DRAFT_1034598 [Lentinula aciculospora]
MASTSSYSYLHKSPQDILHDIDFQLTLEPALLTKLTKSFLEEIHVGLGRYGEDMAMVPSFVTGVPDGSEIGTFLALDLGGTNLRVCEVVLNGDKTFRLRQQKYKVSDQLKTGEASVLFDYLADSVDAFLTTHPPESPVDPTSNLTSDVLPLGLTFSFPVEQTALGSGTILTWTKGFSAKNAIGNDVVKLLQDAFDRKHMHVKCVALVNDTVGALLSRAYTSGGCILGAIFGTGTNGAYLEEVAKIPKLANNPAAANGGYMVVNTEWGAFNNKRTNLPTTPFDSALDRTSINPHFQAFEKFISGMYLGEITRHVLLSLIDAAPRSMLFGGKATKVVNEQWGLDTSVMSEVEEAWEAFVDEGYTVEPNHKMNGNGNETTNGTSNGTVPNEIGENPALWDGDDHDVLPRWDILSSPEGLAGLNSKIKGKLERVRKVLVKKLEYADGEIGLRDAAIVRWACHLVARRAALLSGVAVAAILLQTGRANFLQDTQEASTAAEETTTTSTVPNVNGLNGVSHDTNGRNAIAKPSPKEENIVVGVDGSLIQFYPHFERTMRESLRSIVGEDIERRVEIGLAKDGSGVGAALCALQALKQS